MLIAIEIGGTKLQLVYGTDGPRWQGLMRETVQVDAGAAGIRAALLRMADQARHECGQTAITGVGIGFGGPINTQAGMCLKSHQIHGWDQFPLRQWVTEHWQAPSELANDADVAGLAEAFHGAGRGCRNLFYITVGSGIGGGWIHNQEIYAGQGLGAAEIGHLLVDHPTTPGQRVTIESLASGWGIEQQARQSTDPNLAATKNTQEIVRLAQSGHSAAMKVIAEAREALAQGITSVITLLCPERIVIGGGVSLMGEALFFQPLRHRVAELTFPPFAGLTTIHPAALGEEVVLYGTWELARRAARSQAS